jgi:hypothetical protein
MTDEELLTWAHHARMRAAFVGPMSALWDVIFDAEGHARGERALLDRATIERMILDDKPHATPAGMPWNKP